MKPIRTIVLISCGCLLATLFVMAGPMSGFRIELFQSAFHFYWFVPLITTLVAAISAAALIFLQQKTKVPGANSSFYFKLGVISSVLAHAALLITLYVSFYREWFGGWSAEVFVVVAPALLMGLLWAIGIGYLLTVAVTMVNNPSNPSLKRDAENGAVSSSTSGAPRPLA